MIDNSVYSFVGQEIGTELPKFADGGYPIRYFDYDCESICADCANVHDWSDARIIAAEVFWEGSADICANCNAEIESAYGDPEEN